jgi:hypothetical protein
MWFSLTHVLLTPNVSPNISYTYEIMGEDGDGSGQGLVLSFADKTEV